MDSVDFFIYCFGDAREKISIWTFASSALIYNDWHYLRHCGKPAKLVCASYSFGLSTVGFLTTVVKLVAFGNNLKKM